MSREKINPWLLITLVVILGLAGCQSFSETSNTQEKSGELQSEIVLDKLAIPWAIDFLPSGEMIFTERAGKVYLFNGEQKKLIADISGVYHSGEGGLHGVAIDPDFSDNNHVYIYYTSRYDNRISRFELGETGLVNELIILEGIPSSRNHNGGRIKFGPDKKLYIATGDALDTSLPQDLNSLAGKILRINKDGSIPEDNPFGTLVYSYGHRNPQGMTWHPETGELYSSEHGPSGRDRANIILPGRNYGWPRTCDELLPEHEPALKCFTEFTMAPSGMDFYEGDLYISGLRGSQLRKFVLSTDGKEIIEEEALFESLGRIREVVAHDGYLYVATNNKDGRGIPRQGDDKIIRIRMS